MKFVLDTNVVLDWLVFNDPSTATLKAAIASRVVAIVTHTILIDELQRVLGYPALKLDAERQAVLLSAYKSQATLSPVVPGFERNDLQLPAGFPKCRDPDDQPFIALAFHIKADALVTRDKAVLKVRKRAARFGVVIVGIDEANKMIENTA